MNNVPRPTFIFMSILIVFSLSCRGQPGSFAEAQRSKKATLQLIHNGEKEWAHENKDGQMEGVLAEVMSAFAAYLKQTHDINLNLNYILEQDFAEFQVKVKNGARNTLGLTYMTITEERKKQFKFSTAFMNNIEMMITKKDVSLLKSKTEIKTAFKDKIALTMKRSSNYEYLKIIQENHFPQMRIEFVDSDLEAIDKVLSDGKYFTVVDYFRYLDALKAGRPVARHKPFDFKHGSFGITMPLSSDWKTVLDSFLIKHLKTPRYRVSLTKNLDVSALRLIPIM